MQRTHNTNNAQTLLLLVFVMLCMYLNTQLEQAMYNFEDGYTAENGVVVRYTDTGVRYTYKDLTLEFCGEYATGEVFIVDAVGEVLKHGDYERDDNDDTLIVWEDGSTFNAGCTEEEGEHIALELLA